MGVIGASKKVVPANAAKVSPISPTNRMYMGIGNGVLSVAIGAPMIHAHKNGHDIVVRKISADEIEPEIARLEEVRNRFVSKNENPDPFSIMISQSLDKVVEIVKAENINLEAAIQKILKEGIKKIEGAIAQIDVDIVRLNEEIVGISNSMKGIDPEERKNKYAKLQALDSQILGKRNFQDRYKASVADINGLLSRIINFLHLTHKEDLSRVSGIHVANYLTWPEIESLYANGTKGFIFNSQYVGPVNHPFIFSHDHGIPVVVMNNPLDRIDVGMQVSIDSRTGQVIINPTDPTIRALEGHLEEYRRLGKLFAGNPHQHQSLDGKDLPELQVNIAGREKLRWNKIGLFRTEGLYVESRPNLLALVRNFKNIIQKAELLTLRLFDLDLDKMPAWLIDGHEEELSKYEKGISFLLKTKIGRSIIEDQIKALLIAYDRLMNGKEEQLKNNIVRILLPMVANSQEVAEFKQLILEIENRLVSSGQIKQTVSHEIKIGIMVETSAAVANIESLVEICDFISIGGNDLTMQLLNFVERNKLMTSKDFDWLSPIVLHNIKKVIDVAKKAGKPVGFCGEAARDNLAVIFLVLMGVDSLSMDNSYRIEIGYELSNIHIDEWSKFARRDENGLSIIEKILGPEKTKEGPFSSSVIDSALRLKDAIEVRKFMFELISKYTHADSRLAMQNIITSPVPHTYQEEV